MNAKLIMTPLAVFPLCACTGNSSGDDLPNIIFIVADDLGYGDLSCMGQERFSTPNIDSLAAQGMVFTRHYAGSSVSAPSRSCLLTGLHSGHTPIRGNLELPDEGQWPLPEGIPTVLRLVKAHGYTTGVFGKWGLGGPGTEGEPQRQGVDEFFGYNCQLLAHSYYPHHLWRNGERVILEENAGAREGVYAPELIHREALAFIRARGRVSRCEGVRVRGSGVSDGVAEVRGREASEGVAEPFFMMYTTVLPHAELRLPEVEIEPFIGKLEPEKPFRGCDDGPMFKKGGYGSQEYPHAAYAAMVTVLDRQVGEIVRAVREAGIEDNTLIIFTSDNGPHREGGADPAYFNSSGGLRGIKRDLYEGGIRVPFIAKWKGVIRPGTRSDHVSAFWDFYATVEEIVGDGEVCGGVVEVRDGVEGEVCGGVVAAAEEAFGAGYVTDGISYLPTLTGRGDQREHDWLYWEFHEGGGRQAVLKGDWKAVRYNVASGGAIQLFNLATDPAEQHDVAGEYPEVVEEMGRIMREARIPSAVFRFPGDSSFVFGE